ncbi:MAG: type II secretion system protein GspG [Candidatus Saelkia tenebricola]|nr:type II secretion system protein GspG [Candidatus Saelkia tenebricola]
MKTSKQALTLIELVAVITILGLLAGALTPLAATTMKRAQVSATENKMQALNEALLLYYDCKFDLPAANLTDLEPNYIRESAYANDYAYDAWRKALVYTKTDSKTVTIVSYGPNRTNDSGATDDITYNVTCMEIYKKYKKQTQDALKKVNKAAENFTREGKSLTTSVTSTTTGFNLSDNNCIYDPWGKRSTPGTVRADGEEYHYDSTKATFYSYGPDGANDTCADDDILPIGVP